MDVETVSADRLDDLASRKFLPRNMYGEYYVTDFTPNRLVLGRGRALPIGALLGFALVLVPVFVSEPALMSYGLALAGAFVVLLCLMSDAEIKFDFERKLIERYRLLKLGKLRIEAERIEAAVIDLRDVEKSNDWIQLEFICTREGKRNTRYKPGIMGEVRCPEGFRVAELACWCARGLDVPLVIEGRPDAGAELHPWLARFLSIARGEPVADELPQMPEGDSGQDLQDHAEDEFPSDAPTIPRISLKYGLSRLESFRVLLRVTLERRLGCAPFVALGAFLLAGGVQTQLEPLSPAWGKALGLAVLVTVFAVYFSPFLVRAAAFLCRRTWDIALIADSRGVEVTSGHNSLAQDWRSLRGFHEGPQVSLLEFSDGTIVPIVTRKLPEPLREFLRYKMSGYTLLHGTEPEPPGPYLRDLAWFYGLKLVGIIAATVPYGILTSPEWEGGILLRTIHAVAFLGLAAATFFGGGLSWDQFRRGVYWGVNKYWELLVDLGFVVFFLGLGLGELLR